MVTPHLVTEPLVRGSLGGQLAAQGPRADRQPVGELLGRRHRPGGQGPPDQMPHPAGRRTAAVRADEYVDGGAAKEDLERGRVPQDRFVQVRPVDDGRRPGRAEDTGCPEQEGVLPGVPGLRVDELDPAQPDPVPDEPTGEAVRAGDSPARASSGPGAIPRRSTPSSTART